MIVVTVVARWMLWPTCSKSWHPSPRPFCIMHPMPPSPSLIPGPPPLGCQQYKHNGMLYSGMTWSDQTAVALIYVWQQQSFRQEYFKKLVTNIDWKDQKSRWQFSWKNSNDSTQIAGWSNASEIARTIKIAKPSAVRSPHLLHKLPTNSRSRRWERLLIT